MDGEIGSGRVGRLEQPAITQGGSCDPEHCPVGRKPRLGWDASPDQSAGAGLVNAFSRI